MVPHIVFDQFTLGRASSQEQRLCLLEVDLHVELGKNAHDTTKFNNRSFETSIGVETPSEMTVICIHHGMFG